jgi:putative PEP-CTERM system histidine kinase
VSGTAGEPLGAEGAVWLAVPLTHQGGLLGFILLSPPRAAFALDQEVLDLLRILGQEVASYITQQLATEALLDARHLRDYGQRFAFVAHDIKNVASQLALLLANAEHHVTNPVFQRDMLATIGGSVQKINGLLARLKAPEDSSLPKASLPEALAPVAKMSVSHRLANLVATYRPGRRARLQFRQTQDEGRLDDDSPAEGWIMISQAAFESVITHLLDNAFDASTDQDTVRLVCQITSDTPGLDQNRHVLIDIIDQGVGMSADFIQQELFRPFRSSKADGFGIGVYQARELLRAAGGDLTVRSAPGVGTTMRIRLPLVSEASVRQTWPGEKATPVAEAAK